MASVCQTGQLGKRRPSRIRLEIDVGNGRMEGARIGGHAVKVAEGVLLA